MMSKTVYLILHKQTKKKIETETNLQLNYIKPEIKYLKHRTQSPKLIWTKIVPTMPNHNSRISNPRNR